MVGLVVAAALGLIAAGVALAEGPIQNHIVGPGDTVYRIARAYRVSPQAIIEANRLTDPDRLRPGDELIIPTSSPLAAPIPEPASTPAPQVAAAAVPLSAVKRHSVAPGETLTGIARQHGLTVDALVAANGLADRHQIRAGQELIIPELEPERPRPLDRGGSRAPAATGESGARDVPEHEFLITYYCLSGTMANSRPVRPGVAASDRSVVPLGSVVEVEGLGTFSIEDQFAVDLGEYRLDIWVPTCEEARQRGVDHRRGWVISRP